MSDKVYILGAGMTKFGKHFDRSIKSLAGEALEAVLNDANLERRNLEAAWFSNSGWGAAEFQHCIRAQVALSANGLDKIPMMNVENACGGGSSALHGACISVKSGLYDCVLAIGAEKVYNKDRKKSMSGFMSGIDVENAQAYIEQLLTNPTEDKAGSRAPKPNRTTAETKGDHSVFMDLYAVSARRHMKMHGTTQRQMAVIAAKSHNNSTLNPLAQYTFPQTVEQVIADYEVAYPLTRAMCAPIGDGAAAIIVCSQKFLKRHPSSRAVLIRASVLKSGSWDDDDEICARASKTAYEMSGVGPKDIDVAEVHDATAFGELHQTEQMGFCNIGEGGAFAESGATAIDGRIPVNPSGGLISRGHPIGASGLAQIYELTTHLRGEAGKRQVHNPRIAMAENGGGAIGRGEAAMAIHILEKI